MKQRSGVGVAAILILMMLASCTHQANVPSSPEVSFSREVLPIIISNCTQSGCHGSGSGHGEEFSLGNYDEIMSSGKVAAGSAHKSKLYEVLVGKGEENMPPDKPLSDNQIQIIYIWIEQGAKNN